MARTRNQTLLGRVTGVFGSGRGGQVDLAKLEAKRQAAAAATQEWLSLLREMEAAGQCADARYETYYQAYVQARQQEQRAELDLFNARQGLGR